MLALISREARRALDVSRTFAVSSSDFGAGCWDLQKHKGSKDAYRKAFGSKAILQIDSN